MHIASTRICDCNDLQLDLVGCACDGEPRRRPTLAEQIAEQDRIGEALMLRAIERDQRAEAAYWEEERLKDLARGWSWDSSWGDQPFDEHVRTRLAHLDATQPVAIAA